MSEHRFRPLIAAIALAIALAGGLSVAFFGAATESASAYDRYTIEVSREGFNPTTCRINRGDEIQFLNVDTVPLRVYKPGHGGLPADPDFVLQPGERSTVFSYTAGTTDRYYTDNGQSVEVLTPPRSNTWQTSCAKEAPTPTPTATPTPTLPGGGAPPKPARCWGNGCAVMPNLASDGE
jgi:plastocyanin